MKKKVYSKKIDREIEVELSPKKLHPNQKLNVALAPGSWW